MYYKSTLVYVVYLISAVCAIGNGAARAAISSSQHWRIILPVRRQHCFYNQLELAYWVNDNMLDTCVTLPGCIKWKGSEASLATPR